VRNQECRNCPVQIPVLSSQKGHENEMKNVALLRVPLEEKCEKKGPFYEGASIGNVA
jgi:hypothetical protein